MIRPLLKVAAIAVALLIGTAGLPTARAAAPYFVTVNILGSGRGVVTGPGIACPPDCSEGYVDQADVTLTAFPRHSRFNGWSGDFAACARFRSCTISKIGRDFSGGAKFKRKR